MKKLIFLLAAVALAAFFLRRNEASKLWDSAIDTASAWGKSAASKTEEVAEAAAKAPDGVTGAAQDAARKAKDVAE